MAYTYVPYEGSIVTRAEAKAAGLTRYFTGEPCPRGHVSQRWLASYLCDGCQRANQQARYHADEKASREKASAYYYANLEVLRERSRKVAAAKYEERKPYFAAWNEANRVRLNAYSRKRFAKATGEKRERYRATVRNRRALRKAAGGAHTAQQIKDLLAKQRFRCVNCRISLKKGYHVDHIKPLSRGGSNDITNLQILCAPCNQSKFTKDPIDWARANGRLL